MSARLRRIVFVLTRRLLAGLAACRFGLARGAARRAALARQARLACEELGGTFIKIGQLISVRPDIFPPELVFELESLRDRVPELDAGIIREVIRAEFGRPAQELFASFDDRPLASASIAQVHRAVLREPARPAWGEVLPAGAFVAVKVVRPGVAAALLADLELARGGLSAARRLGLLRGARTDGLLDELEASARREVDLRVEGRTADRFAFLFRDEPGIRIPRVVWGRTGRLVLTMEFLEGWSLADLDAARRAGVDTRTLARRGAEAFMRQVLVHGLFHADLHHANLLATPDNRIAYLDFGICGSLTPRERECVAQLLAALVYRDAARALRYSAALGVVIPPERIEELQRELSRLMDLTLGGPGGEGPDVRHFGMGFLSLLRRHRIPIPAGYSLLVKSLVTVEGVSRELHPDIDIIETARPFVTRLLAQALLRPDRLRVFLPDALRAAALMMVS